MQTQSMQNQSMQNQPTYDQQSQNKSQKSSNNLKDFDIKQSTLLNNDQNSSSNTYTNFSYMGDISPNKNKQNTYYSTTNN